MSDPDATRRLLFVGDTAFGENYQERAERRGGVNVLTLRGYERTLEGVAGLTASADFVVANLETPLTRRGRSPLRGRKKHIHRGDPRRTPAVLRGHGVGAVSLGNNHVGDYGEAGLRSTLEALGRAAIVPFGAGLYESEAARPFVREFDVGGHVFRLAVVGGKQRRRRSTDPQFFTSGASAGVLPCTPSNALERIRALRRSAPGVFIVAFPHWGLNYTWRSAGQARLARAFVDGGADLVLGHGAHMMQEIERHAGRWIVYGLGNFVFNSPGRYQKVADAVPFSLAARLDVSETAEGLALALRLYPILSDNRVTDYRPRPVTADEMDQVRRILAERSPEPEALRERWSAGADDVGPFLATDLGRMTRPVATSRPTCIVHRAA